MNDLLVKIEALLFALGRPLSHTELAKQLGASVENIDLNAAREFNIAVVRTNGTESATDLGVRFLFAALDVQTGGATAGASTDDISAQAAFHDALDLSLEELRGARERAAQAGRGTMDDETYYRLFHPISEDRAIKLLLGLRGQTVGLIGFGRMGRTFAKKLNALRALMEDVYGESFTIMATSPSLDRGDAKAVETAKALAAIKVPTRRAISTFFLPRSIPRNSESCEEAATKVCPRKSSISCA